MTATLPKKTRKRNRKKTRERNRRILRERQRRILNRIDNRPGPERDQPMMTATNIHYELADRVQGLAAGGIGAMLLLARRTGLIRDIDHNLHLLKRHLPYHESDHVLNIAFNILAGGKRIEHLELRRNDEVYLDALGAERIPDPTTAGDFCRRFAEADVVTLMDAINRTAAAGLGPAARRVLRRSDPRRRRHPRRDRRRVQAGRRHRLQRHLGLSSPADLAGQHRRAALPGQSQRQPPLARAGRRLPGQGDRPVPPGRLSADPPAGRHRLHPDQASRPLGRRRATSASSSGSTPTQALKARADELPAEAYSFLERPPRYEIKTVPRQQPERVKPQIVRERGFETIHLLEEMIAEFDYRPVACRKSYRVIVAPQAAGDRQGADAAVRGVSLLLLHHQRPRHARPRRSCSRPMTAATRRT